MKRNLVVSNKASPTFTHGTSLAFQKCVTCFLPLTGTSYAGRCLTCQSLCQVPPLTHVSNQITKTCSRVVNHPHWDCPSKYARSRGSCTPVSRDIVSIGATILLRASTSLLTPLRSISQHASSYFCCPAVFIAFPPQIPWKLSPVQTYRPPRYAGIRSVPTRRPLADRFSLPVLPDTRWSGRPR